MGWPVKLAVIDSTEYRTYGFRVAVADTMTTSLFSPHAQNTAILDLYAYDG